MIRDLIRKAGETVVHAKSGDHKAFCEKDLGGVTTSSQDDDTKITCEECRDKLNLPKLPQA